MHRDRQAPASTPRGGEWFVVRHELDAALYVLLAMKNLGRDLDEVEQVRRVQRVRQREMAAETNAERPRHRRSLLRVRLNERRHGLFSKNNPNLAIWNRAAMTAPIISMLASSGIEKGLSVIYPRWFSKRSHRVSSIPRLDLTRVLVPNPRLNRSKESLLYRIQQRLAGVTGPPQPRLHSGGSDLLC